MYLLSGNTLKFIAATSMLIDHIGYIFFPYVNIFRIIGRLSFPIFAFMIAEGCRYTKNKLRYFLTIFILAVICQCVYLYFDPEPYFGILFTFSLSISAIFAMEYFKEALFASCISLKRKIVSFLPFILTVAGVYFLNRLFTIDYGFWGCMAPVFAAAFHKKSDKLHCHVFMFSVGLIFLSFALGGIQPYCLLALPFLFLYSGKRGRVNMKYFFYVFYPLHIAILYGVYIIFFS